MQTPSQIAAKFAAIDAHDDTVEGFVMLPSTERRKQTAVEVTLFRHWQNKRRVIRFIDCANVGMALDADVLKRNGPSNTAALDATSNKTEIESLMRNHKRSWHVTYEKVIDPLPGKLAASKRYVLFRVRLFGGLLEIVAKSFSIKRLPNIS
jgi:hypothetical protein